MDKSNKIIAISLVLIIIILLSILFIKEINNGKRIKDLEESSILNEKQNEINYRDINQYSVQVLQLGGVGSRFEQKIAWLTSETEYLHPAENWVFTLFNTPADIMYVSCKDNYIVKSCRIDEEINDIIDKDLGCVIYLQDKMKTIIDIDCVKN